MTNNYKRACYLVLGLTLALPVVFTPHSARSEKLPDLRSITLTAQDLKGRGYDNIDWQVCADAKVSELQQRWSEFGVKTTNTFCFGTPDPLRIVSGFTVLLPSKQEQAEFDEQFKLSKSSSPVDYAGKYDGTLQYPDAIPQAEEEILVFRRNRVGVFISNYNAQGANAVALYTGMSSLDNRIATALDKIESARTFSGGGSAPRSPRRSSASISAASSNPRPVQPRESITTERGALARIENGTVVFNYDFGWLSQRRVSEAELKGYSALTLDLLRNSIFARHGRRFATPELQNYFSNRSWYKPRYAPSLFPERLLSPTERANVDTINRYQQRTGLRYF